MTVQETPVVGFSSMNISVPPEVIGDTELETSIDSLFNQPGIVRRRGATKVADLLVTLASPYQILKSFTVQRTDGTTFIGNIAQDPASGLLYFISCDKTFSNYKTEQITSTAGTTTPLISVKPALGGGVWVGISNQAEATGAPTTAGRQFLWYWKGASFTSLGIGLSATPVALNDTTVTLASAPTIDPIGAFIFNSSSRLIGVCKSVSGAVLTLEKPATETAGGSTTLFVRPIRGYMPHYSKGRITTSTANTAVAGAGTDFTRLSSVWRIYRSSDNSYVGQVTAIANSTALTLNANALVNMTNEPYWAIRVAVANTSLTATGIDPFVEPSNNPTVDTPGWINTVHQGRQWFANKNKLPDAAGDWVSRVWFSDLQLGEAIDYNLTDGDFLQVGSGPLNTGPILELVSMQNQLLVFKESEVWAIVGDAPSNYTSKKFFSDGLLCTMAWAPWNDGVVWIGRKGLWYYDGVSSPVNLVKSTMGDKWLTFAQTFSQANADRCWLAVVKDHAIVSMSSYTQVANYSPTLHDPQPVVYIPNQALTFWTNMRHQGGFTMGGVLNSRDVVLLSTNPTITNAGGLVDMSSVFNGNIANAMDAYQFTKNNEPATLNVAASPGGALPLATIKVNGVSIAWSLGAGTLYINGDPLNVVTYTSASQAAGVTTFVGCSGGTGGITPGVTVISNTPLGPFYYHATKRYDAGNPMVRKGWRQVSFQYLANGGNLNFYTNMNHNAVTSGVATRQNPTVAATGAPWGSDRQRFGHTGFYLQWILTQADANTVDIRVGASTLFWKPQRARRVH